MSTSAASASEPEPQRLRALGPLIGHYSDHLTSAVFVLLLAKPLRIKLNQLGLKGFFN